MRGVAAPTSKNFASHKFSLANGAQLQLALEDREWKAYVTESNGCFNRAARLPVVCEGNQEPSSVLEALFKQPSSYVNKRVHIMDARPPFAATRFVFVGQLGILGGSPGSVEAPPSSSRATKVLTLPALLQKKKIDSTIALANAFNAATPSDKAALSEWANEYVVWLEESTVGHAVKKSGAYLKEYALLANVLPRKAIHKGFRRAQFEALVQKVLEDQIGQVSLMESLESCLKTMNKGVLTDRGILHNLVSGLLLKLDKAKHPMSKKQFNLRRSTLYCCYYALLLLKDSSPSSGELDPENTNSLYNQFTSRLVSIAGAKFYPYSFHVQLLSQWVVALQAEKEYGVGGRLKQGVTGAVGVCKAGVALATGDVEGLVDTVGGAATGRKLMAGLYSGYNAVRKRVGPKDEGVLREWHELYEIMNQITEEILRVEDKPEELSQELEAYTQAREEVKQCLAKGSLLLSKESSALSYILISFDGRLALDSSNCELRKTALELLRDLIDPEKKTKGFKCLQEYGLCEVYLDLLATIACHGVEESERTLAKEILCIANDVKEKTKGVLASKIRGLASADSASARKNVNRWLKEKDLDARLESVRPPPKECELGDLFEIILNRMSSTHEILSGMADDSLEEESDYNEDYDEDEDYDDDEDSDDDEDYDDDEDQ